jgi:N-carbamoylputrescine amidase
MNIAYVQWPEGLQPEGAAWDSIRRAVDAANADILVTNEMPFGAWLAEEAVVDADKAQRSVDLHERALGALRGLNTGAVISSRPVAFNGRLANEAFVLESDHYRAIHQKHYFPAEPGFFEATWFGCESKGFDCVRVGAANVGVLLCTELFFNEHARHYGRLGADVIVAPRATGTSLHRWKIAGMMAAIVSGAYLISSNRIGVGRLGQEFGGGGFAISPDGHIVGETDGETPLAVTTLDLSISAAQKSQYPCYVKELVK